MAGNTKNVNDLTQSLRDRAYPAAKKEVEELKKFAESRGHVGNLEPWDLAYYAERQREELFGFTQEELRPYFALPNVLEGLFSLCEKLFDVTIVEASSVMEKKPAKKFKLGTRTFNFSTYFQKMIPTSILPAFFWIPFLARKRSKGAWMAVCRQRSDLLNRKPVAYLTCNGTPPVNGAPSLMTFNDFCTLFHEFGHGLQHMLTKVPFSDAAGISGIEWDAVELPSQFMENWCYHKKTVDNFAKHYETGEKLPEYLVSRKYVMQKNILLAMVCWFSCIMAKWT